MRKFICLLLALCLMVPFAMAEEDEDELSLSDWMDMPVGQEQSADDVPRRMRPLSSLNRMVPS